jgi:outer membrane protein OmpA-like peptidoglycan-associated protein
MPAEWRFASIESASEDIDLSIFVLFPHDQSAREDIRSPGRAELAALAEHLKSLPASTVITVVGHADITGAPKYNQALSERRAQTVAAELNALGIDPSRIQLGAAGAQEPVVNCSSDRAKAQYLAWCIWWEMPSRRLPGMARSRLPWRSRDGSSVRIQAGFAARRRRRFRSYRTR